jgi:uncharacterized protein (DUF2236 family)
MATANWYPRDDIIFARQQIAEHLLSKMMTGLRLDQAVEELIRSINDLSAPSQVQAMAFASQHRHGTTFFVTASTVRRWFFEAIPNPKERLREHAQSLLASGQDEAAVCEEMGIERRTLRRWLKLVESA